MSERGSSGNRERRERSFVDKFTIVVGPKAVANFMRSRRETLAAIRRTKLERASQQGRLMIRQPGRDAVPTAGKFSAVMGPGGTAEYLDEKAAGEASVAARRRERRIRANGKCAIADTGIEQP